MLALTPDALDAIRMLEAATGTGVRISAAPASLNGAGPAVSLEIAESPEPDDEVVDADGALVFLAPSTAAFEDKVLDAGVEGGEVHFSLHDQE